MTQSNFLELAKQGDPQAIATLMNRSLQPKGLTAKAAWVGERLQVLLEADQVPNRQVLTSFVQNGLQKLGIPAVQTVEIVGKQVSADAPAWSEEITLAAPSVVPPAAPPPVPPRAAIAPPPPPPLRNPNIVSTESAAPSLAADTPSGLDDVELDSDLEESNLDDTSTLLASLSAPVDQTLPTEPTAQRDGLAADLDAVSLDTADNEPGPDPSVDTEPDVAMVNSASAGFVLPGLNGNELPTLSDSLTPEDLHALDQVPVFSDDSAGLATSDDESDQLGYIPSTDLEDLENNGSFPSSNLTIDDLPETVAPPLPESVPPEPPVYPLHDDTDLALGLDHPEGESPAALDDDEEELVEERSGFPAAGWFAAGLLGVLVFGILGYSLVSNSLGGSSLLGRVLGTSPSPEPSPPVAAVTPLPAATPTATPEATPAPLQEAIALEPKIAGLEANAQSVDDWNLIVGQWQAAIALLQKVPANSPDGAMAQQKLAEFQQRLAVAQQKASQPAAANTPSSTTTTTIAGAVACQSVPSQSDSQPVELSNLKIQPGQGGNVIAGCLTNHTDQAIAQVSVSYEALSTQDPNLAQGGLSQIASTPLQPRQTVPFTGTFTLDPNVTNVKIESIFWTPAGTQEPQRIPTQTVIAP